MDSRKGHFSPNTPDLLCVKGARQLCCDRKCRAAYAQSFALWQQAIIEFTCHDHFIIACLRHIYVWCCSSRTSRSWWITQSTQRYRRGCNNIPSFLQRTAPIARSLCEGWTPHDLHILVTAPFCWRVSHSNTQARAVNLIHAVLCDDEGVTQARGC